MTRKVRFFVDLMIAIVWFYAAAKWATNPVTFAISMATGVLTIANARAKL